MRDSISIWTELIEQYVHTCLDTAFLGEGAEKGSTENNKAKKPSVPLRVSLG